VVKQIREQLDTLRQKILTNTVKPAPTMTSTVTNWAGFYTTSSKIKRRSLTPQEQRLQENFFTALLQCDLKTVKTLKLPPELLTEPNEAGLYPLVAAVYGTNPKLVKFVEAKLGAKEAAKQWEEVDINVLRNAQMPADLPICDLFLMPSEEGSLDSEATYLRLYKNRGKLIYNTQGKNYEIGYEELKKEEKAAILSLFQENNFKGKGLLHTKLKLEHEQKKACEAILTITSKRGHTLPPYASYNDLADWYKRYQNEPWCKNYDALILKVMECRSWGCKDKSWGADGCDLVSMPSLPNQNTIKHLPILSNAAYIYSDNRLSYINIANNICKEIQFIDKKAQGDFIARLKPINKVRTLSKDELELITSLTAHTHAEGRADWLRTKTSMMDSKYGSRYIPDECLVYSRRYDLFAPSKQAHETVVKIIREQLEELKKYVEIKAVKQQGLSFT
jgi:hypothetical protein